MEEVTHYYTVKEAAHYLDIGTAMVYVAAGKGTLPGDSTLGYWRFTKEHLDAYREYRRKPRKKREYPEHEEEIGKPLFCHECRKSLTDMSEYQLVRYVDKGRSAWHPVCRDGKCDTGASSLVKELHEKEKEIERLRALLVSIRQTIDIAQKR